MGEYTNLVDRNFEPYSEGHRVMYTAPIDLIKVPDGCNRLKRGVDGTKVDVLDVGCGIGWGLMKMIEADLLNRYIGIEPDGESCRYCRDTYGEEGRTFIDKEWLDVRDDELFIADYTFCIEVIEHVGDNDVIMQFLEKIRRFTKRNLFISTPDSDISRHGVLNKEQMVGMLASAGFKSIPIGRRWTTLYVCE